MSRSSSSTSTDRSPRVTSSGSSPPTRVARGEVRDLAPVVAAAHERGALVTVAADLLSLTLLASARRARRRHRRRIHPALRGAAVLRRPARRLHGRPRRPRASPARPPGRCLRGQRRPPGVPARAPDPRAAHPSRQGDVQHLYGAGAARRRCLDVRRLPRPGRAHRDRAACPRAHGSARRGPARGRHPRRATDTSSTPSSCEHRDGRGGDGSGEGGTGWRCGSSTPTTSASAAPRSPPPSTSSRSLAAFGVEPSRVDGSRRHARRAAPHDGVPDPSGLPRAPLGDAAAALPAQAVRPRLRPGPRNDPARLLHDEAQRHDRDGAGLAARASPTCTRSRPSRTRPATSSWSASSSRGWPRSPATRRCRIQPNAGSQGELAGLLAISAYHRDRGEGGRDVCLIPASAHGTNAASAVLAGHAGRRRRLQRGRHRRPRRPARPSASSTPRDLAAIMVTYPSTHGVYEQGITRLCELVHDARRPGLRRRRQPQRAARGRQAG